MKRTLFVLLALCLAVPVIAATIGGIGGSGGGGGAASAAGSTNAVQTNVNGALADSGCLAVSGSAKMACTNGLLATHATLTNITATQATTSLITASFATITQLTVTQRTGNGAVVYATSPTLGTPNLGVPSSINLVNATAMPATGLTGTVAIGNGGTGSTSFTGSRCIESNAGGTALVVAAAACGTGGGGAASAVGASGTIQAANNSSALSDSGCTVGSYGRMTCPGGFVAGTSSLGVISMIEGSATIAGATPGEHNIWIDSTDGVLHTFKNGAATAATYMTVTTPATPVNKTWVPGQGSGNIFKFMRTLFFPLAGCNGTTCGPVWDLPSSNAATVAAVVGTNTHKGVAQFSDNADQRAQLTHHLPNFWTGSVPATIAWYTTATTGNVRFHLQTVCTAQGATDDPAFNATDANNTVTKAAQGTTLQVSFATMPAVTMTGCSANNLLHLQLRRVASDAADTLAATASVISVQLGLEETHR